MSLVKDQVISIENYDAHSKFEVPTLEPQVKELLLKQYDTLRKEIEFFIAELSKLSYTALLGTGTIWSALLPIYYDKNIPSLTLFIPAILALVFFMRAHNIQNQIKLAGEHLADLENAFGIPQNLRWDEKWAHKHNKKANNLTDWLILRWLYIYWMIIFAINAIAPLVLQVIKK